MLKFQVDTIEGLPEALASEYTLNESDNKYYLNVDGAVSKTKLNEFRETNVTLMKELDTFKTKYANIDPEEFTKLKETFEQTKDKVVVDPADVEELNKLREEVITLKKSPDDNAAEIKKLSKQIKALEDAKKTIESSTQERLTLLTQEKDQLAKTATDLATTLNSIRIESAVKEHAISAGVAPAGLEDVLLRARATLAHQDGKIVVLDSDGTPKYAANGSDLMSVSEWMGGLKKSASHLFLAPRGSGAQQSSHFSGESTARSPLDLVSQALSGR